MTKTSKTPSFEHPLFRAWPRLAGRLSTARLGAWPTPVHLVEGGDDFGPVWIKRDDLSSALYGGNKVRKLELLLAESRGPVLTCGGYGSHHVLATALHAHAVGRSCAAVLFPSASTAHHEQVQRLVDRHCDLVVRALEPPAHFRLVFALLRRHRGGLDGGPVQIIGPGATSPRGVLGYVGCGIELAEQIERGACPRPDRIYAALGTGGTVAGLALGLGLRGVDTTVVGVRVASRISGNIASIRSLMLGARALLRRHGVKDVPRGTRVVIDDRFIGDGYAISTREAEKAVRWAARRGIALETTYTGKALAAALADRRCAPDAVQMLLDSYGPIGKLESLCETSRDKKARAPS